MNRAIGYPRSTRVMLPMECIGSLQKTLKVPEEEQQQQVKYIEELKIQIMEQDTRMKEQNEGFRTYESPTIALDESQYINRFRQENMP